MFIFATIVLKLLFPRKALVTFESDTAIHFFAVGDPGTMRKFEKIIEETHVKYLESLT